MSVLLKPDLTYDPVTFIENNCELIIPKNSQLENITFSGFTKKAFHSNKRPKGVLTVSYKDEKGLNQVQLFVKQHAHALRVYKHVSHVYSHLSTLKFNAHVPKPIACDEAHNVNYMEFIPGIPLTYTVIKELVIRREKLLLTLFEQIGRWLKNYHDTFKLEDTFILDELKENIFNELHHTKLFNSSEKITIENHLKRLEFDDTFLLLVKSHNDFALRNIIHTKENDFYVIDWDAIFNEEFTVESPAWIDITSFIISLNSMQRFSPVINSRKLKNLTEAFLRGYFDKPGIIYQKQEIKKHLYLFSLCFYIGVIGERPLPLIYREKFGYRYINKLRLNLVKGMVL